jgi:hypothetical protein
VTVTPAWLEEEPDADVPLVEGEDGVVDPEP